VAANEQQARGVAKDDTPATSEEQYGSTSDSCFDDPDPESLKPDRDRDIKAAEFAINLLLSARTDRVRHMRASIAIALLKNNLNLGEIAKHFGITSERVTKVVKDVKGYEVSE
jgi:DNA-directed RNA polymerase sigma subunit (sigma70/sigma32)